jgi:hypothetical protein
MRKLRQARDSIELKLKGRRLGADHRPADAIVIRLFSNLQAARNVQRRTPSKAARARQFERRAWSYLMEYLLTLDCSDPEV